MIRERLYKVLIAPQISEKATWVAEKHGQYVFRVAPDATKPEIKQAVEALFEVKVQSVQVVNIKGKTKRTARGMGKRNDVRKAYVRLVAGQDIDFADAE
ncbi:MULTISPECIES: 50S ribosomal protein L23 [unclassified Oceanobacter]|jgi:large subunit ribosomal protein L23|uniref:50S ribosomal protein L23 n=1 Tax=unclassified Oceanobacter TaxID=2620260 RepID=UPI0026E29720|nr:MULTISPECIES: 50S ribosomal protein L23 [unclassified Oceanobacter]MDO6683630.1 50S ribosomal protein L23 [Oceanobacter sp. 5_MG-2023]MDP2506096.1 50S ribosomal protein L23 [Oceanobacter sp. 3_MG-2023]MDP2610518.1 50S ribosomal protein L23 [Oceanobacter sp. 1_MG-2023]MDP2613776.1 50S ribosomal protein L23 [Oceanobacter sp. 2_MG-2023]